MACVSIVIYPKWMNDDTELLSACFPSSPWTPILSRAISRFAAAAKGDFATALREWTALPNKVIEVPSAIWVSYIFMEMGLLKIIRLR